MNIYDASDECMFAFRDDLQTVIAKARAALRQLSADALALAGEES